MDRESHAMEHPKKEILKQKLSRVEGISIEFSTRHLFYIDFRTKDVKEGEHGVSRAAYGGELSKPDDVRNIAHFEGGMHVGTSRTKGEVPERVDGKLIVYYVLSNEIIQVMGNEEVAARLRLQYLHGPKMTMGHLHLGLEEKNPVTITFRTQEEEKEVVFMKDSIIRISKMTLHYPSDTEDFMMEGEYRLS